MSAILDQSTIPACAAGEVYDLLVRVCGALEDNRDMFLASASAGLTEFRLASRLGRGGNSAGARAEHSRCACGEPWRNNCAPIRAAGLFVSSVDSTGPNR